MTVRPPVRPAITPSARRQVREFARLVDGPGAPGATGPRGESAGGSADSRRGAATDRRELAELAGLARSLPSLARGPQPAFRAALRERLLAETIPVPATAARRAARPGQVRQVRVPLGRLLPGRRSGLVRPLGALALVVALLVGVVSASSGALPGDPLYGVKRSIEAMQLTLASSDAARGSALLGDATTRLHEAERLLARSGGGSTTPVHDLDVALAGMQAQASEGSGLLLTAFRADRDPADLSRIADFLGTTVPRVHALAGQVPVREADRMAAVRSLLAEVRDQLARALTDCGGPCSTIPLPAPPTGTITGGLPPTLTPGTTAGTGGATGTPTGARPTATGSAPGTAGPVTATGPPRGVGVTVTAVPSAPATVSVGTRGASVGASLPVGGGATVVVGPTTSVSICVPIPLVLSC